MHPLSELQQDALAEAFNIGIGQAAASLSAIVREPVRLSVLSIQFVAFEVACHLLGMDHNRRICAVTQEFSGTFDAVGLLVFPEEQSLEVVRLMLNETMSLQEMTELEQDAMSEIGNILLNACTSSVASLLSSRLTSSLPTYHLGAPEDILRPAQHAADAHVMLLHLDLALEKRQIGGIVAFMLDAPSLDQLITQVDHYLAGMQISQLPL
jgi:chemotaxis protein CheC